MSSAKQPKWLDAPQSTNTVRVRMIDTTGVLLLNSITFVEPVVKGRELMSMPDFAFLVENERLGKKLVFDLGIRKDFWNLPPLIQQRLDKIAKGVKVDSDVPEILKKRGISLDDINDVFWSHSHWDHTGDPSLFPSSTLLNFGPGLSDLKPGYPEDPESRQPSTNFSGRTTNEIDFDRSKKGLKIGGFRAYDFYHDGSFYLLETPGHSKGHMCGLARVGAVNGDNDNNLLSSSIEKSTFILLGGDVCHFTGDLRPNSTYPLPQEYIDKGLLSQHPQFHHNDTSGGVEGKGNNNNNNDFLKARTPWYKLSTAKESAYDDPGPEVAQATVDKLNEHFDQAGNVFVLIAHDHSLYNKHIACLNREPERDLNDWYSQGLKDKIYWSWINELDNGNADNRLVDGFWKDGERFDTAKELIDSLDRGEKNT